LTTEKPVIAHVIGTRLGEMANRLRASSRIHVEKRMPCQKRGMYQARGCLTVRGAGGAGGGVEVTLMPILQFREDVAGRAPRRLWRRSGPSGLPLPNRAAYPLRRIAANCP
jgi:hypothetical protein